MSDAYIGARMDYEAGGLEREGLLDNPFEQLRVWLEVAASKGLIEPNAMCLSTVDIDGFPSSRMVLLRQLDNEGLIFFTNYESEKGRDIEATSRVAVCFWWGELERQVRVEGLAQKLEAKESDAYFDSRPLESRAASACSPQSQVISGREDLEHEMSVLVQGGVVNRPTHWGGYRIYPNRFEFWQGRSARLHDRFQYSKIGDGWQIDRLAP